MNEKNNEDTQKRRDTMTFIFNSTASVLQEVLGIEPVNMTLVVEEEDESFVVSTYADESVLKALEHSITELKKEHGW